MYFHCAKDVKEVVGYFNKYGPEAKILAGGTDLMVGINEKKIKPAALIYIGECGLSGIKEEKGYIKIGAATTFNQIIKSSLIQKNVPLLQKAATQIASTAIRNMGTIGGNLANASPAADSAVALLALGAKINIFRGRKYALVNIEDFFKAPGKSILNHNEMITEVWLPIQPELKWAYYKIGRRQASTLSVVSAAVTLQDFGGKVKNVRVALGAVAPTPMLSQKAAAVLEGKSLTEDLIEQAAAKAGEDTNPIDDVRGTAWYRQRATKAVVKRLLQDIAREQE